MLRLVMRKKGKQNEGQEQWNKQKNGWITVLDGVGMLLMEDGKTEGQDSQQLGAKEGTLWLR